MAIMLCQSDVDSVRVDSGRDSANPCYQSAITEIDSVRLCSTSRRFDLDLLSLIHDACTKLPLNAEAISHIPNALHLPVGLPSLEGFIRLRSDRVRYFTYRRGYFESYIPSGIMVLGDASEWFVAYHCAGDTPTQAFEKVLAFHPECLSGYEFV